jgi:hypothetical protein
VVKRRGWLKIDDIAVDILFRNTGKITVKFQSTTSGGILRELVLFHSGNCDRDLNQLREQIFAARKKLQTAWAVNNNKTDSSVLAAGDEFDRLEYEYMRLSKK